jgi:hypothetical protein
MNQPAFVDWWWSKCSILPFCDLLGAWHIQTRASLTTTTTTTTPYNHNDGLNIVRMIARITNMAGHSKNKDRNVNLVVVKGEEETASFHTATPDVSWDDSSASSGCNTEVRPSLKIRTQKESLQQSFYQSQSQSQSQRQSPQSPQEDALTTTSVSLSCRVDFSTQTEYYHDLCVDELRYPDNEIDNSVHNPHSMSLQADPWQVSLLAVPPPTNSRTGRQRKEAISRWGKETRERVWARFCQESVVEEDLMYADLCRAETDLDDVTALTAVETDPWDEGHVRSLDRVLDAMETLW